MSADNWRKCPKCLKRADAEKLKKHEEAAKAYGQVNAEQWRHMIREAEKPVSLKDDFREDYEIGVTDCGEFYVRYSGSCTRCGWSHTFKHGVKLDIAS